MRTALTLLAFLLLSQPLWGQDQQPPSGLPGKPDATYLEQMEYAKNLESWGLVYFNSYLRTKEVKYLLVAGEKLNASVASYANHQASLALNHPNYYKVRDARVAVCRLYDRLKRESERLSPEFYLPALPEASCRSW